VQTRYDIEIADPAAALESWELFDTAANTARTCPHFSIEMETGTGKTYVYLRTVFELPRRYGFQKFIIVVPSVAIREGVLKNIEITAEHFRALYNNLVFEHFVYDAKKVNRLRQFAVSNTVQILVINIDAFRKNFIPGFEADKCLLQNKDRHDIPLRWDNRSARELAGKTVRLRFRFRGASIQRADGQVVTAYYASSIESHPGYHMGIVVWDPAKTLP